MMYESDPWEFQLLAAVARRTVEIKAERDGSADDWGRPTEVVLSLREQLLEAARDLGMSEREGLRQISRDILAKRLDNPEHHADFYQAWREVVRLTGEKES